jgi:hypothetical protein
MFSMFVPGDRGVGGVLDALKFHFFTSALLEKHHSPMTALDPRANKLLPLRHRFRVGSKEHKNRLLLKEDMHAVT